MNELSKNILKLSEKYKDYTAENLSKLVKIKSLSTKEKDIAYESKRQMEEANFDEVRIDQFGNVIGRIGNGKKILAIDAHIDTVGEGNIDNWKFPPFSGLIKDGFVYGRGSVDQKGGAASMVTAGRILKELNFEKDLTIYFTGTVIEEDCEGLCWKYIIEEDKIKPDIVLITEPTNLNLYIGQRGRMDIEVSFFGVSAHGSAPERGKNAIYPASKACLEIEKLNDRLTYNEILGKGSVTVSEFISSSPSLCAVADFAKIHLDRRLTWGETKESALQEIQEIIKNTNAKVELLNFNERSFTGLEYGMEKYFPTWRLDLDQDAVKTGVDVYKNLFNKEPKVDNWTFSTNGVVINGVYQIPTIGFGPGDEIYAHAPNEKVPIEDLVKASAFYTMYAYYL